MNPHRVGIYADGYKISVEREFRKQNQIAYIQGQYYCEALMATVGNMFSKKGSKPYEYPEKPYEFGNNKELNDDELQRQRELFVATLLAKQANFELEHPKGESE